MAKVKKKAKQPAKRQPMPFKDVVQRLLETGPKAVRKVAKGK